MPWRARLIRRWPLERLILGGNLLSLGCAAALVALTLLQQINVPVVVGLMLLFTLGSGLTSPLR